jgi:hypothetical protein
MNEPCNSWPNRETWLVACWLSTRGYGELMNISCEMWRNDAKPGHDARVRRKLAYRMRAMVEMAGDSVDGLPPWRLSAVHWERLSDDFLGGIRTYRQAYHDLDVER